MKARNRWEEFLLKEITKENCAAIFNALIESEKLTR